MKILITDGDTRAALAIVRSLGKLGHEIHVGTEKHPALASVSKFCSAVCVYAVPKKDNSGFLEKLIAYCRAEQI